MLFATILISGGDFRMNLESIGLSVVVDKEVVFEFPLYILVDGGKKNEAHECAKLKTKLHSFLFASVRMVWYQARI